MIAAALRLPLWTLYFRVVWLVVGWVFSRCGICGVWGFRAFLLVEFLRAMESGRQAALSEPHSGSGLPAAVQPATAKTTNDMVAPGFRFQADSTCAAAVQVQLAAGSHIDYNALQHLRWSPRKQPDRVVEVGRAIRDVTDRTGLGRVLQHPAPTLIHFEKYANAVGMQPCQVQDAYRAAAREWWDLNTALYYVLSPAILLEGPLARSDPSHN